MAKIFELFDFNKLQEQAGAGELDMLLAFTSDGAVTGYARPDAEQSMTAVGSYQEVSSVQGPKALATYYKCKNHHLLCCYIDPNGNERCTDTGRAC